MVLITMVHSRLPQAVIASMRRGRVAAATRFSFSSKSGSAGSAAVQQRNLVHHPTVCCRGIVSFLSNHPYCYNKSNDIRRRSFCSSSVPDEEDRVETINEGDGEEPFVTSTRSGIRNVAVIAHVDHGKTTLVDQLLKSANNEGVVDILNNHERLLDSGDLEKERGITITSKVTRIAYEGQQNDDDNGIIINCADTPGHADFSGEVDRFLSLSDGFLLVVDAAEGPKSQTKYVLSRALALHLQPIVVLNKCDRPDAIAKIDTGETEEKLHALFEELTKEGEVPDHVILYASARQGWVTDDPLEALDLADDPTTMTPDQSMTKLLEYIVDQVPEPAIRKYGSDDDDDNNDKFSLAAVTVGNDNYLGRTCTGRIVSGTIAKGDKVKVLKRTAGSVYGEASTPPTAAGAASTPRTGSSSIADIFIYKGIEKIPLDDEVAMAGDIVTIAGVPESLNVGDTLTKADRPVQVPLITPPLAPPTLSMEFGANDGPLAGKEGSIVASSKIRERLFQETDNNVTLKVEKSPTDAEKTVVYARGELQLGILIEEMRREGFEMVVSPPRIVTRECPKTGKTLEPYEEVTVDVDSEYSGTVISALTGDRRGIMVEMSENSSSGKCTLVLHVPTRGLLGFGSEIASATKGSAVVNHLYLEDREYQNLGAGLSKGKLVCNDMGKATGYALSSLSSRGVLFIEPGDMLYSGMVVGEYNKNFGDIEVNATRAKQSSNIRTHAKDERVMLPPPNRRSVEELIGYMEEDEVIEITPKSIRLRKTLLDKGDRERALKARRNQMRAAKAK